MSDHAVETAHGLAILIVAYRSPEKLEKCLKEAERHLPYCDIHIWDNSGLSYPAVRLVAARSPGVRSFTASENIGFAAAVNRLATRVSSKDMLLLNPDAELLCSLPLTQAALRERHVGAAAPMVWDDELTSKSAPLFSPVHAPWDVAHRRSTWLNAFCMNVVRPERLRGTWLSDRYRSQPTDVDGYLTGACLAIRREAWNAVGPFDEEFFLYGEESDWQTRAAAAGWKIRLADEIGVRHSGHGTVAGDFVASKRSHDLLRAAEALRLEYLYSHRVAELFIAFASLTELIKGRVLRRRTRGIRTDVMITVDALQGSEPAIKSIGTAAALDDAGYRVAVVSLKRLGALPRDLPSSIRLIRRPWWLPSMAPDQTPRILVTGRTSKQSSFARLFRLRRRRLCISPDEDLETIAATIGNERALQRSELEQD
jgi:GT2 family glycosyltransferase